VTGDNLPAVKRLKWGDLPSMRALAHDSYNG